MPRRFSLLILSVMLHLGTAYAQQPGSLPYCMGLIAGNTYAGCVRARICLHQYLPAANSSEVRETISLLNNEAARRGNPYLRLYAQTTHIYYVLGRQTPWPDDSIIAGLEAVVAAAVRLGDAPHIAWAECELAAARFNNVRQYDLAFEASTQIYHRTRAISEAEMPDRADILGVIANFYYYFGEYRQAIDILHEAVGASSGSSPGAFGRRRCFNTLGLCYRQLGLYDSSGYCFREALLEARLEGDSAWTSIIRGNLGINLYRQERYAEAMPLLTEDVHASAARGDWNNAAGSLLPLADIALKAGQHTEASVMLDTARRYLALHRNTARLPFYYSLRIRESAFGKEAGLVAAYTDSLSAIKDSLAHQYSALHLARAEQRLQTAGMRAELAAASSQKRIAMLQRNGLVVILLLTVGAGAFGYLYFRRRRVERQGKIAADMRAKEAELADATAALKRFRQDVQEKAGLIEQLSAQLAAGEPEAILHQLREATILTDAQWLEFRRLFEKVHAGFIERLGKRYAGLTAGEVRFLVLARLGFSTKEMAGALGVSTNSVRVTWHRLRKKLELEESVGVEALVEGI